VLVDVHEGVAVEVALRVVFGKRSWLPLQAMADHTTEDADHVVDILDTAIRFVEDASARVQ
jgi:hypothetical protein